MQKKTTTAGLTVSLEKNHQTHPTGSGAKQVMLINDCTNRALTLPRLLVQRSMQSSERAALHYLRSHDGGAGPLGRGRSF